MNTQHRNDTAQQAGITMQPVVFSPDMDGFHDFVMINYRFNSPGTVCSISIYDAGGTPVRTLVQNHLCGISGGFRWDGLDQRGQPLSPGIYHIQADVFRVSGFRERIRHSVALLYRR